MLLPLVALVTLSGAPEVTDVGPLVRSLWLVQRHGTADALNPANDQRVKAVLSKAIAKDGVITLKELGEFMQPETFNKIAGSDASLDSADTMRALEAATPKSRAKLTPTLSAHADYLATTFDMIDEKHRESGEKLAH